MSSAIQVEHLRKVYGSTVAVDDVSLEVGQGEIFAMIGPNGAGKTTTIECIEGLRKPDGGTVRVLGLDPQQRQSPLRDRIGVQLQQSAMPGRIKVWEAMDLFASFYERTVDWRRLLDDLGLAEKSDTPFLKLSGGQRQRLFIALALINDAELLFLDELTTGLDPHARHKIWEVVSGIRDRGKTIFLTTHFMEEAERLADRVAIIDKGRIVAVDTPGALIRKTDIESRVTFDVEGVLDTATLTSLAFVSRVERNRDRVIVYGRNGMVGSVVQTLEVIGCRFRDLRSEPPNLEDVYLSLTGKEMRN